MSTSAPPAPPSARRLGTSSLVVAAFIGPGTVLTCASAGVGYGYALGWVLVFATAATFVLQSFTAASGILAGRGLGEAIRHDLPRGRTALSVLVVLGLWVGCAAFELGNLLGAASGLAALWGSDTTPRALVAVLAGLAGVVLLLDLRALTRVLAGLVAVMSVLFFAALALAPVDWGAALPALVAPRLPDGSLLTTIALIGTTVVTYNLFLHASATRRYWADAPDARQAWRQEIRGLALFVGVGGLVSLSILWVGATLEGAEAGSVAALAPLLEPVAGASARWVFGLGLFAAGLTSAITAPLAAAAGVQELFGWTEAQRGRYRAVWLSVLATGLVFGLTGWSPLRVIIAAQAANGLLLPFIAALVLYLARRQRTATLPGWYLGLGALIVLVCAALGARTLWWVWTQVMG